MRPAGIVTTYAGVTFRSRLEARWAVFFDLMCIPWIYEPFDAHGYVPDFLLTGDRPLLVEVKPLSTTRPMLPFLQKTVERCDPIWQGDMIVVGVTPLPTPHREPPWVGAVHPVAGVMAELMDEFDRARPLKDRYAPGFALWARCSFCGKPGFFHGEMSYAIRPCGHHDGDHYLQELGPISDPNEVWMQTYDVTRWGR